MSNKSRRLYTGFTSDLPRRVIKHKLKLYPGGFIARIALTCLSGMKNTQVSRALELERSSSKAGDGEKKLALIRAENPDWADLSLEWQEDPGWKLETDARLRLRRKPQDP